MWNQKMIEWKKNKKTKIIYLNWKKNSDFFFNNRLIFCINFIIQSFEQNWQVEIDDFLCFN